MKKLPIVFISIMLIAGLVITSSCKKEEDTSAPVVTLIGDSHIFHILNQAYVDPGAIATDNDAPIEVVIEIDEVEVNLVGDYKVIWSAIDSDGNKGSAERTVTVYNEANPMIGNYNIHVKTDSAGVITEYDYTDMVVVAGNVNNQIWVNNFNNYQNAAVYIQINGTDITVPNQTVGNPPTQRTFSGWGLVDESTGLFEIHSMEIVVGPPSYNKQSVATYIKQ